MDLEYFAIDLYEDRIDEKEVLKIKSMESVSMAMSDLRQTVILLKAEKNLYETSVTLDVHNLHLISLISMYENELYR